MRDTFGQVFVSQLTRFSSIVVRIRFPQGWRYVGQDVITWSAVQSDSLRLRLHQPVFTFAIKIANKLSPQLHQVRQWRPLPDALDGQPAFAQDLHFLLAPHFIKFVDVVMSSNKVYSFFTEISVEDKSEQVYTRIGQVCKHDGGWRNLRNQFSSFFKARLNCSLPGQPPFYFNELSDVTELVTLDKLYKVGKTKMVFALMNTPSNSIPASAICAFSLPDIEASMNGVFYEKFADAKTSAQYWAQQDNYSEPHLASCASDPSKLSVRSLNFMRMHPIMYQSVNAWDLHNNVTQPHNAIPLYSRTNSG
ncbi:unnamed protein product [Clavelina lepadiformis]|uniref:Sema domain-containing protein n=2 Tax=Clavelina lepadiformis TaxID=159417 RepID=A0ABP0GME1_CLALP